MGTFRSSQLKKFIYISLVAHALFAILMILSPSLSRLFPARQTKITWIQLSKGTGEKPSDSSYKRSKNMPDSTIREQKDALREKATDKNGKDVKSQQSPVKKPPVQEYVDKHTNPNGGIQFKSKPGTEERKMEEALARMQEELKKRQVEIEAAQIEKEGVGQSPEGSLDAKNSETNPQLIAYYEALKRKINEQWITTPKADNGTPLKTQITVLIDSTGHIVSTSFEAKSGDASFDASAMRAVEAAAPFPTPPETIRNEALTEGFLIEFNPRNVVGGL